MDCAPIIEIDRVGGDHPGGVETVTVDHILWLDQFTQDNLQTLLLGEQAEALSEAARNEDTAAIQQILTTAGTKLGWVLAQMRDDWQGWLDGIEATNQQLQSALVALWCRLRPSTTL